MSNDFLTLFFITRLPLVPIDMLESISNYVKFLQSFFVFLNASLVYVFITTWELRLPGIFNIGSQDSPEYVLIIEEPFCFWTLGRGVPDHDGGRRK